VTRFALLVVLGLGPAGAGAYDEAAGLVALGPRVAGTAGGHEAQRWTAQRLADAGLEPLHRAHPGGAGAVLGCTGDPDGAGWLLAHTDTVHQACPGAVDNAGAVGVALEVAARLAAAPPSEPVCVAFPDGEELGLRGSRVLAGQFQPAWVISLELLGQGRPTAMGLGPTWGTAGLRWASSAGLAIPWAYRIYARQFPELARSDHGPFAAAGIPGLLVLGRPDTGVYWPYHTARDDLARLDPQRLDEMVDLVEGLMRRGPPDQRPGPALQLPGTRLVVPGAGVVLGVVLGLAGGAVAGRRAWGTAVRGLAIAGLASAVGALCWVTALLGRSPDGALAAPGLAAWAVGALAVGLLQPRRDDATRGGALLAVLCGLPLCGVDWLLALPLGLAAGGLALAERWPAAGLLALPLPLYLAWPDTWRELVFHGVVPPVPWVWAVVLALVWAPVLTALGSLRLRPPRWALGLALVGVAAWAALTPAWTDAWPARVALWPW